MPESTSAAPKSRSNAGLATAYSGFAGFFSNWQSPFLLLIRVYIGYQCIISGWAHFHHLDSTADFFTKLHIPFPKLNVIMSASTELFGGGLLLVGLASRLVAAVLTGNFLVAMLTVQLSNFHFSWKELGSQIWADQSPILGDTAFPFLATAIIILLFGPGLFSIDAIIKMARGKK